jgi:methylenetetrahydrofolate dehydrogenase (NADP+) / methenyltetrahydrofolate cyclohydrolase
VTATLIDGKAIAAALRDEIADRVAMLPTPPGLATVLVGDDPASTVYVASKRKQCTAAGMRDLHRHLPGSIGQAELAAARGRRRRPRDPAPAPAAGAPRPGDAAGAHPLPAKDVDGLTEASAGRLVLGTPGLRPCTPSGVLHLLDAAGVALEGAEAVVVGRSALVGKPVATLLLERNATVTTCHSRTTDLASVTRRADVLVVAAGRPHMIGPDAVRPGAVVIDVGVHRRDEGLCGDVDTAAVAEVAGAITPVPGGVGPMTIAMLLRNTVLAAQGVGSDDVVGT